MNRYERQNSNDAIPPPLIGPPAGYQPPPDRGYLGAPPQHQQQRIRAGPSRGQSTGPVQRKQTVRGAVRGTIREVPSGDGRDRNDDYARRQSIAPTRALTRGKTLTRPDRFVAPAPLINPQTTKGGTYATTLVNGVPTLQETASSWDFWGICVNILTFWAPRWLLNSVGFTDPLKQRAWKEKCALCTISALMMGVIGFVTIGLTRVLCPVDGNKSAATFTRLGSTQGLVGIQGWNFKVSDKTPIAISSLAQMAPGTDISDQFDHAASTYPGCTNPTAAYATTDLCANGTSTVGKPTCALGAFSPATFASLGLTNTSFQVGYDFKQVANLSNFFVIDGNVLNLTPYMSVHPTAIPKDPVDVALRYALTVMPASGGRDATRIFYNRSDLKDSVNCLVQRYYAGHIDKITPGCFVSQLFLYVSLVLIMSIILARFFMACLFSWYLSSRLVAVPKNLKRNVISPAVMPEGANIDIDNATGAAPWVNSQVKQTQRLKRNDKSGAGRNAGKGLEVEKLSEKNDDQLVGADGMISMASIGAELFCVCLVTCYSEGADGIKTTLDSIAAATYTDARKLLFIVCDGMITGEGEKMSTPDICVALLEADPRFGEPQAMSYVSIAEGSKAHNQAMVYAGHYTNVHGRRCPTIVVVKCGPPEEAKDRKPGNRGKRDSQMILMNFFSRVTYNDRMSPLDYDLFRKVQSLMGVTPDFFEVCLMVDADTKVYPDSISYLVRCMQNDNMIMGVCGETRIANKRQSWVTAIQVFEYFISHHLAKAFESVFGGVTCLPGCFSMYRLKARKANDGDWFPVLVQPQIISEYSQSVVTTLHQKNLLLLGEDRFLTTLLLRTFPNRKMMFCPQARCRTIAPDTFSVLLSQRRRWINSTIHNLMELVLVRNLCGTFCFSMQAVVFIDLIGTVVLPVAICLTYTLLINYIFNPPANFSDAIPLMLLGAVLGLPAVLIMLTTFKIVYVGWMLVYLIALPVWNFVLPLYAFSKFDDFSWGATRLVAGEVKGADDHSGGTGVAQTVPLRRWEDWERSRLRKIKRDEKRRKDFERQFGTKSFHSSYEDSVAPSDTASLFSASDESDRWGVHLGEYSEDVPSAAPPPVGLYSVEDSVDGHQTIAAHEMELVLEQGWNDESLQGRQYGGVGQNRGYMPALGSPTGHSPPPPPRLYSLSDQGVAPAMEPSFSGSSQQHLTSSTSSLNSSYEGNPFANPRSPSPGTQASYPLAGASRDHQAYGLGNGRPGVSTAVGRSFSSGHGKQRSLSGNGGEASDGGAESPMDQRDRFAWGQDQPYGGGGGGGGGARRLV